MPKTNKTKEKEINSMGDFYKAWGEEADFPAYKLPKIFKALVTTVKSFLKKEGKVKLTGLFRIDSMLRSQKLFDLKHFKDTGIKRNIDSTNRLPVVTLNDSVKVSIQNYSGE